MRILGIEIAAIFLAGSVVSTSLARGEDKPGAVRPEAQKIDPTRLPEAVTRAARQEVPLFRLKDARQFPRGEKFILSGDDSQGHRVGFMISRQGQIELFNTEVAHEDLPGAFRETADAEVARLNARVTRMTRSIGIRHVAGKEIREVAFSLSGILPDNPGVEVPIHIATEAKSRTTK